MSTPAISTHRPERDERASDGVPFRAFRRRFSIANHKKIILTLLFLPVGLWVAYVVIANAMLATGLIARLVSWNPEAATLHYDSAWTLWPGVVHVKGFRLSGADSVLQWMVGVDDLQADIKMRDVVRRTFRASHIRGEGYVFRVRLRVDPSRTNDPEVAALPPIPGQSNPPLLKAGPPEELSDEDYNLWTAQLEDIDVTVREVWIQQFRYVGEGRVRGGFYMKPVRAIRVDPTVLELASGEFQVADKVVARIASGMINVTMNSFDPRLVTGLNAFSTTAMHAKLEAQVAGLDFINVGLASNDTRFEDGSGEVRTELIMNRGLLEPGSFFSYKTSHLAVSTKEARATFDAAVDFNVPGEQGDNKAILSGSSRRLSIERNGIDLPAAVIEGASVVSRFPHFDITQPLPKAASSVRIPASVIPDLRWLNAKESVPPSRPIFLGGAAFFRTQIEIDPEGRATGNVRSLLKKASMRWPHTQASGDATIETAIDTADPFARTINFGKSHIDVKDLVIKHRGETFPPWWASIDVSDAKISGESGSVKLTMKCKDAQPAVGILDAEDVIPGWAKDLLTMTGLDASIALKSRGDAIEFDLLRAQGDGLDIRGRLLSPSKGDARGAFLVRNGPVLSVGITAGDSLGITILAGDDWLKSKIAELGGL